MSFFEVSDFGARVKNLRLMHALTQADLARMMNVTPTQISDVEKGKTSTSLARAVLLAEFFNVSLDSLVGLSIMPEATDPLVRRVKNLPDSAKERLAGYLDGMGL